MEGVTFFCNNYVQVLAEHHVDAPHETPHLYTPPVGPFDPAAVGPHESVFVKTDFLDHFLAVARPRIAAPFVLFTGHSDLSPSHEAIEAIMQDADVGAWYAQNTSVENFKIRALPMGFSEPSRAFGDQDVLRAAHDKFARALHKKSTIAVPPTSATHPLRAAVGDAVARLAAEDLAPCFDVAGDKMSFAAYLDFVGAHEFCLVPRGNAIDCHRVYECVAVRTVPVVISDDVPAFYNRLPVIVLQPRGEETVYDVIRRFGEDLRAGLTPPLPTAAEWERAIGTFRVENARGPCRRT